jgi:hypothetical protein
MKWRGIFGLSLVVALMALALSTIAAAKPHLPEFEGFGTTFKLEGTNGYEIWVSAYSRRRDGQGWISIGVGGKHAAAIYRAPARVRGKRRGTQPPPRSKRI